MELIYASLLLHSLKQPINEENINKIFSAIGAQVDPARVKALVVALEGVNIDEAISKAAMPVAGTPKAEAKEEKKEEEKKEEEDVEKRAEQAVEGLSSLFSS